MAKPQHSLAELTAFAHELADAAGAAILPHFRRRLKVDNKKAAEGGYDPVTAADKAAEKVIAALVRTRYPDHGFEGEEFGHERSDARFRWIVDPIDGTRSFVIGMPIWGTLIALSEDGRPVIGVMDQPFTKERFWAARAGKAGGVSRWRGADGSEKRLKTRSCASLSDAIMTTTGPEFFAAGAERRGFERVRSLVKTCRFGGDCYAYCLLAAGHIDVIVEAGLKPFDIAALVPIIENAGGRVTTWDGGSPANGGRIVACGDPALHAKVLRELG